MILNEFDLGNSSGGHSNFLIFRPPVQSFEGKYLELESHAVAAAAVAAAAHAAVAVGHGHNHLSSVEAMAASHSPYPHQHNLTSGGYPNTSRGHPFLSIHPGSQQVIPPHAHHPGMNGASAKHGHYIQNAGTSN